MLKLSSIRIVDRGDFDVYFVRFSVDGEDSDLFVSERVLHADETLDSLVAAAREEVIERLKGVVDAG